MPSVFGWTKGVLFSVGICVLALGLGAAAQAQAPPAYKVDAAWPKQLPNNWIMGQVGGMAVDGQDHIWVMQRPGSNTKDDLGAAQTPPASECCVSAPPVLVFDAEGNLLKSWGGAGSGYDWPSSEHSIFVDHAGNVWITGNGAKDRQAIKFTSDGKFILEIGHPSAAPMNNSDTTILGRPAGIELDEKAHEIYFADGYLNRRIIVFDSETGRFQTNVGRVWKSAERCGSHAVRSRRCAEPAVQKSRPRGPHFAGWFRVCLRSNQRQNSGFHEGGKVREGIYFAAADARQWLRVRSGLLA